MNVSSIKQGAAAAAAAVIFVSGTGLEVGSAFAATTASVVPEFPKYRTLRQDEDWSGWKSKAGAGGLDSLKYIEVSRDGAVWLSLGAQLRERLEVWDDFAFGAPAVADDVFLLTRLFAHADLHIGETWRVFVQAKSALSSDRDLPGGRRTLDMDRFDIQNGFVEFKQRAGQLAVRVRAGREELLFGKQRLVSPLDWSNTRRTFDGANVRLASGANEATLFFTKPVVIQRAEINDAGSNEFYGIYATHDGGDGSGLDLYLLALDRDGVSFNGNSGNEERYTTGIRLFGALPAALDYDLESAYQFGRVGSADVDAYMVASQLGGIAPVLGRHLRWELGFDYASGDDSAGDGDVGTFNQLFPLGHAYLGYIDIIGRQNIMDARASVKIPVAAKTTLALDLHSFRRAEAADALYNAGGKVVRAGAPGSSKDVGRELDVTLKHKLSRHILVLFGFNHFFPGDFIDETGASKAIDFGYAMFQYTI